MTTSWTDKENTWPVLLYRRERDGWKKQELQSASSSSSSSSSSLSKRNKNRHQHSTTVMVAPRKECIVFPTLRQRFSLKSQTDQGTVMRRNNKILLTSKRRTRSLLLQFQSLEDCLAFSDKFIILNPNLSALSLSSLPLSSSSSSSSSFGDKKAAAAVGSSITITNNESASRDATRSTCTPQHESNQTTMLQQEPIVREKERKEVVSWVTRLLHDDDFLGYVHKIETYISGTDDGEQILHGLENRLLPTV